MAEFDAGATCAAYGCLDLRLNQESGIISKMAKFSSESDDLVIGRNAVLEALRCGVPASTLYVAARIEHDDRTREIIRLAGIHGLNLM